MLPIICCHFAASSMTLPISKRKVICQWIINVSCSQICSFAALTYCWLCCHLLYLHYHHHPTGRQLKHCFWVMNPSFTQVPQSVRYTVFQTHSSFQHMLLTDLAVLPFSILPVVNRNPIQLIPPRYSCEFYLQTRHVNFRQRNIEWHYDYIILWILSKLYRKSLALNTSFKPWAQL